MSELLQSSASAGEAIKALIIYDDFASAAQANTAIQRSARNANSNALCAISPWRIEMLKFPLTAEEALTDALDAHVVVIAGRCAQSPPSWLQCWLEHWAKCRQIKGAALALFGVPCTDGLADAAMREFSGAARRHGLSLIFDDGRNREARWNFIEVLSTGRGLFPSALLQPVVDAHIRHPHLCWGINE